MRLILILIATVLFCSIVDAKKESGERGFKKKRSQSSDDPKKCREENCDRKNVDKYKEGEEGKNFRWNRNFKNHKNNIYDVDKKETESVYKPNYKRMREDEVGDEKRYVKTNKKKDGENENYKKRRFADKKQHAKIDDSTSIETEEDSNEISVESSKEIQCDSSENTCRAE